MVDGRPRVVSDFLKLELALALWFWLSYSLPGPLDHIWDHWPALGLAWFAIWIATPVLTLVGLLMLPRAFRARAAWLQILIGTLLATTIWWQVSRIEF